MKNENRKSQKMKIEKSQVHFGSLPHRIPYSLDIKEHAPEMFPTRNLGEIEGIWTASRDGVPLEGT